MRRLVLLCLTILMGACANQLAQRQAFLNQFVGHPEQDLVQRLGVPNRSYATNGTKYLAYDENRVALLPPVPPPWGVGPWWLNGWYGGGLPPEAIALRCETTFTVADGVVKSYTLRGNACG